MWVVFGTFGTPRVVSACFGVFHVLVHVFLYIINTLISNAWLNLAKNQPNAKQNPEAELLLFEIFLPSSARHHPKVIGHFLKISKITSVSVLMKLYH